ncbi:MAG: carboxypeptidase regulatory-like domain-containing protein [Caldilineaceae bacterium]|nr:carboxypeptidase regulatory-like domain-containing protein [Caldilineaceae bacterium]
MEHLAEERMMGNIWDGVALTPAEVDHLRLCAACQSHFAALAQLRDDFEVARRSQVAHAVEERYFEVFTQARQAGAGRRSLGDLLGNLAEWVAALPLWDSRDQMLTAGVRNGNRSSYRILYGTDTAEIELMIEPQNGLLRLVGELMTETTDGKSGLALVELMAAESSTVALETQSDGNGRFQLEHVPPGRYALVITPRYSQAMVIKPLELT